MPTLTPISSAPQSLWNSVAPTSLQFIEDSPAFSLDGKTYGTGQDLVDESAFNKNKIGAHFGGGFFITFYAFSVMTWMNAFGRSYPGNANGITTFTNAELDQLVDNYMIPQAGGNAKFIIVDFEPSNPSQEAWAWDYSSNLFSSKMQYIADRISAISGGTKYFYDWISADTKFTFNSEQYSLGAANNDGYSNNTTSTNSVNKLLEVHRNIGGVAGVSMETVFQAGMGYSSIVYNSYFKGDTVLGSDEWRSLENVVLRGMDGMMLRYRLVPSRKAVGYFWPFEDKPGTNPGRRSQLYNRFTANSSTNSYPQNLNGKSKIVDNRTTYPSNIIEDTVLSMICFPNYIHSEYWIHGGSYNPYASFKYTNTANSGNMCSFINGGFTIAQYDGTENNLACPSNLENYLSTDNRTLTAFLKAQLQFSKIKHILNGTQEPEYYHFQYKRSGAGSFTSSVFENHGGQYTLAAKESQPVLLVWRNTSNERVLLFWDLFADAFASTEFSVNIGGSTYTGNTKGNRLFVATISNVSPVPVPVPVPIQNSWNVGNITMVGDSLFRGHFNNDYSAPAQQLRSLLISGGFTPNFVGLSGKLSRPGDVPVSAEPGWTMSNVQASLTDINNTNAQTFIISIGTNDFGLGLTNLDSAITTLLNNFSMAVGGFTGNKRIMVCAPVYLSWFNITEYNNLINAMSAWVNAGPSTNRKFINLNSSGIDINGVDGYGDNIHWSLIGANKIGSYIYSQISNWAI